MHAIICLKYTQTSVEKHVMQQVLQMVTVIVYLLLFRQNILDCCYFYSLCVCVCVSFPWWIWTSRCSSPTPLSWCSRTSLLHRPISYIYFFSTLIRCVCDGWVSSCTKMMASELTLQPRTAANQTNRNGGRRIGGKSPGSQVHRIVLVSSQGFTTSEAGAARLRIFPCGWSKGCR